MFYAYLFATIVGAAFVLGSLVFGGDHEGDGAGGHDHGPGDDHAGHDHDSAGHGLGGALFSVQVWTYFLAFAGITGLLLHSAADTTEPLRGVLAAGVGLASGLGARWAFAKAASAGEAGMVGAGEIVGRTGTMLLPCRAGEAGQVRLTVRGSTIDLLATTGEADTIGVGREVLIIGFEGGEARVLSNTSESRSDGRSALAATDAIPTEEVPVKNSDKELT